LPRLAQQLSDLVCYLLLPLVSLFLPARASRALIARLSRWDWLMAGYGATVYAQASRFTQTGDPRAWRSRWRQVELLDSRDLWYLTFGRKRSVFREVEGADGLESARGRVLIGMHWGPAISILRLLADRGLKPSLIYREEPLAMLFRRPFFWLFLRLSVREIRKACAGREIRVGGAGGKLARRLEEDGADIVVLDAPPVQGRSVLEGEVLGRRALFNAGFPGLLARSGKEYLYYAMNLAADGSVTKSLELGPPGRVVSDDPQRDESAFLAAYCHHLGEHLGRDSAQWRIWEVAPQFFPDAGDSVSVPAPAPAPARQAHGA
jgi:hypothetical protein